MKVKIGSGEFKLEAMARVPYDRDLLILLERQRRALNQLKYCDTRPSNPNPLKDKITAETNLLFYAPQSSTAPLDDLGVKFSDMQIRDMQAMSKRFKARAGISNDKDVNAAVQKAFGTYAFNIPWAQIAAKAGPEFSVSVVTIPMFRSFYLRQMQFGGSNTVLSIPYKVEHRVWRTDRCTEQGVQDVARAASSGFDFKIVEFVKPKTEAAQKARKEFEKQRRKEVKRQMEALKKELLRLDEDKETAKSLGE